MVLGQQRGAALPLTSSAVAALKGVLDGEVLLPGDERYDEERKVFNAAIDRRPALIARIAGPRDAQRVIAFAKMFDLPVSVRGGGHSTPGFAVVDGGVMIDTGLLKGVQVDVERRVARAGAGLRAGEYVAAVEKHGLVSPVGDANHTGLGGLTLGGGYGWLSGKLGLVVDNLIAAEIVTADGRALRASEEQHADLFWALRGGSGNFGVVTSFEFALTPITQVLGGMLMFPYPLAGQVARVYRDVTSSAPDDLTTYFAIATMPDGNPVCAVMLCYSGDDLSRGEELIAPFRALGPVADMVQPMPYSGMGALTDPFAPEGLSREDRWLNVSELSDDTLDAVIALADPVRSHGGAIVVKQLNGVAARASAASTAFPHRHLPYSILALAQWIDPALARPMTDWVHEVIDTFRPITRGVYVNGADDESMEVIYGSSYDRLVAVKNRYDPTNFFAGNVNIMPTR